MTMPRVTIVNNDKTIESSMARSLLVSLLSEEIPIETICGGKAICGKCLLRIVEGLGNLSPVRERERLRLAALGADSDMRLACQSHAGRDITIEIINYLGKEKKGPGKSDLT